jgi:endoglycosylceramidase
MTGMGTSPRWRRGAATFAGLMVAAGAASTAGCVTDDEALTPAPAPAGYHVGGGFLRDPEGRALLLRGMNLSGAQKEAPYLDFHELPDYQRVRDPWGMNAIRYVTSWAAVEPSSGVYDETYLDALAQRMDWARQAGLFVVIDMHQDVYGEGFVSGGGDGAPKWTCDASHYANFVPNTSEWYFNDLDADVDACYDGFWHSTDLQRHYVNAWKHLAARLSGYDDVILGFDPMNEPYWGTYAITAFEADLLEPFYLDVVAAVRAERPEWVAFLEPASSRNLGIPTSLTRFPFPDVVYSPHSYDRDAESGAGFDATHRADIIANGAALQDEATALGTGLWVGEYGGQTDTPGITPYMDADYTAFAAVAAGTTYWDYSKGGSYSTLDADGNEKPELMAALVRPWPARVAGTPVSYDFDASTSTFTLTYQPDATTTAPTVIMVPDRVYPSGYTVDCGGCSTERVAGELHLLTPPRGAPAVVTVHP